VLLKSFRRGATLAELEFHPAGVCMVTISGLITVSTLISLDHHLATTAPGTDVWLADFRSATVALTLGDMHRVTDQLTPDSPMAVPIAVVTAPDDLDLWRGHMWYGVQSGLVRSVHLERRHAVSWSVDQARRRHAARCSEA